jgi:hypothetical protein
MRRYILIAVCLVFGTLNATLSGAQTMPKAKKQDVSSSEWFGKCLHIYNQTGRTGKSPAEICRRIKGRIEAKHRK